MDSAVALGEGPLQAIEAQRESERAEQHAAPPPAASRPPLSPQRAPALAGSAQGSAPPPAAAGADLSEGGLLDPNLDGLGVKRDGSTSPPADPSVVLARAAATAEGFGLALGEPPSGDGITAEQRVAAAGFGAVPPAADDGAVRTASTAVTVGPEEVAEAERLLRASAAEADADAVRPVSSLHLLLRVALHCLVRCSLCFAKGFCLADGEADKILNFQADAEAVRPVSSCFATFFPRAAARCQLGMLSLAFARGICLADKECRRGLNSTGGARGAAGGAAARVRRRRERHVAGAVEQRLVHG